MSTRSLLAVAALIASATAAADPNAILDRDMRTFLEWFPGVYDNQLERRVRNAKVP